jgi:hypothetical protein
MKLKTYQLVGIDVAMHLLRPGAKWEITNGFFSRWDDPRPCPSWQEVMDTVEKIKAFEDSINTILLPEQEAKFKAQLDQIEQANNS